MFVVEYRLITQLAFLFQNESFTNQRAKRISHFIDFKKYRVSEQFAMCFGTSCTGLAVPSGAGVVSALYTNCVIYILLLGCYIVQYPRKIFFITPERTYLWSEKKWKIEVKNLLTVATARILIIRNPVSACLSETSVKEKSEFTTYIKECSRVNFSNYLYLSE